MAIREDFLHYIWKFRLFDQSKLYTANGDAVEIVQPGVHNNDAGPDFQSARIRIGDTLWAGNVEIHLKSSDWERHRHQTDKTYDNVILHVVGHHDRDIFRTDRTLIPVLSLEGLIPEILADKYLDLIESMDWIACETKIARLDSFYIRNWLYRVEVERLEEKADAIEGLLTEYKGGWDDAFYIYLARSFGFKINAIPFEMLARSLPQNLLARYKDDAMNVEALIFGQAGFLEGKHLDNYPAELSSRYRFLKVKHTLKPIDNYLWKYLRMRPVNFPPVRLAQFAALIISSNHLFSKIISEQDIPGILKMFHHLPINPYWQTHYRFDTPPVCASCGLGEQSINNLIINTVSVFMMAYGRKMGIELQVNRSIQLLERLSPETNALVNRFKQIGVHPESAFFSQSLIQLKKAYCDQKKCLSCGIGTKLLNV